VRITGKELIVYGPDMREIARHELYPSGITREKHSLQEYAPGRDHHQKCELLKERFTEFGPDGVLFFDELIRTRRRRKTDAAHVLGLLATYHRDDLGRTPILGDCGGESNHGVSECAGCFPLCKERPSYSNRVAHSISTLLLNQD